MTLRTELGRILITGAGGRVATAFRQAMGDRYALRLAERDISLLSDLRPGDEVISFNIADLDACRAACANIDTVLHLAADPSPDADFCGSLMDNNILGTFNNLPRGERRRLPPGGVRQQRAGGGRLSARLPNPPG